jgi:hypothetical protein
MGRKWGQWLREPEDLLGPLLACGFDLNEVPDNVERRDGEAA